MKRAYSRILRALAPGPLGTILRAMSTSPVPLAERLASFPTRDVPVEKPVEIRWNEHHVPFITAQTDRDLAFSLGMIQAHLRGGQIDLFRYFFLGRLSELIGPFGIRIDHAVRVLGYDRGAEATEAGLSDEARAWTEAFVAGLNHYRLQMTEIAPELRLLGARIEPYTVRELLIGGRFGATDFTWLTYFTLLAHHGEAGFARIWNRTLEAGETPVPGTHSEDLQGTFEDLLVGAGRHGSNSVAVAPSRSATGAALLANDPHLGLSLPNLWLLVGIRSPSYHAVGMMIPGLPALCVGRNPELAWGGTNLHAASSDLYDVTDLPADQIESRTVKLRVRGWGTVERTIRSTPLGPIITDAKLLRCRTGRSFALRWVGHQGTDEYSAFLRASRAGTPTQFREAFKTYGVSGQNFLFADRSGNIGHIIAVKQPLRDAFPKDDPFIDGTTSAGHWRGYATVMDLPFTLNPPGGVLASANDRPRGTSVPIGFTFGSEDRIRRLYQLLNSKPKLAIEDLSRQQTDTHAPDAAVLAADLVRHIEAVVQNAGEVAFLDRLKRWDGDYGEKDPGPVAFESLLYHLVPRLNRRRRASKLPELMVQWSYLTTYLMRDLEELPADERTRLLQRAVRRAARDTRRFKTWGDMHRLEVGHMLARLPLIGPAFIVKDIPCGGSRQTPMKMAHGIVHHRHFASFGSMARHISDMSDPDHNWFVLLGGQDGWLGSTTFADQLALWRQRHYIHMPLKAESVAKAFPHLTTLTPPATSKSA